ncbi:MAG: acetolactate synthase small subunit [Desulfovibrio sp.]|jgi:acetolactate synthase-1/3 small subunit|nr:acetolactate synthase small subunit [Desulfovibrio sp.]
MKRHVISILMENEPGVLSRVCGLFSGRGFNIETINAGPSNEEGVHHMNITTFGDDYIIEQIMKQLNKVVSVIKATDYEDSPAVEREMMFLKVQAEAPDRGEILRTVEVFRCKVVDVSPNEMIIEATGNHEKLEAILTLFQRFGIKELARTGPLAMLRSKKKVN